MRETVSDRLRFDRFELNVQDRRLTRDGADVDVSGRYLDALILLAREPGRLITKDRFLSEVWRGVPVTDEALTQCIRSLRRELGDDAARPRFIQTVPKHGYRFLAEVAEGSPAPAGLRSSAVAAAAAEALETMPVHSGVGGLTVATAGAGALAGLVGGLLYGLAAASVPHSEGVGGASTVIVLVAITVLLGAAGGAAVGGGLATARALRGARSPWTIAGAAVGGLLIGGLTELIGGDAATLLLGRRPADVTGGFEGAALGAAIGLSVWLAVRTPVRSLRLASGGAAILCAAAGLAIALLGGRMLAGSLTSLIETFPGTLQLEGVAALFGETQLGPRAAAATAALEAGLFGACVTAALLWAGRSRT